MEKGRHRHSSASGKQARTDFARLAAVRVIRDVTEKNIFSNDSAAAHLAAPELDARDRAFASAIVFGTLTELPYIDYAIASVSKRPLPSLDPWVRAVLRAGVWQLYFSWHVPGRTACDESVRLARRLAGERVTGFVNGIMRRLTREKPAVPDDRNLADALMSALPPELFLLLTEWYGKEKALELGEWSRTSCKSLSVRPDARRKEAFDRWLESAEASSWRPQCLLWPDRAHALMPEGRDVTSIQAYREGLFSLQSQSAMLAASLLGARAGEKILDYCAAPGGKTASIAEQTNDRCSVTACDLSPERTEAMRRFMERHGHRGVTCLCLDASLPEERFRGAFDRVLCDVPCSGLGLLPKRPEIRLHVTRETIRRLIPTQQSILRNGARAAAPGGTLLYSTCTINPEENEEQIKTFLASPEGQSFRLEDLQSALPAPVSGMMSARLPGTVLLLPPSTDSDGFFIARMVRREG